MGVGRGLGTGFRQLGSLGTPGRWEASGCQGILKDTPQAEDVPKFKDTVTGFVLMTSLPSPPPPTPSLAFAATFSPFYILCHSQDPLEAHRSAVVNFVTWRLIL